MRFLAHALTALVLLLVPAAANAAQPAAAPAQQTPAAAADAAAKAVRASRDRTGRRALRNLPQGQLDHGRSPSDRSASEGERNLGNDPRGASRSFAGAVVADDHDALAWIGLARALLAINPDPNKGSERYDLPVNASGAAYLAYERATDAGREGARARRAGEALRAALVLASRDRCPEDEPVLVEDHARCARPMSSCALSTASA